MSLDKKYILFTLIFPYFWKFHLSPSWGTEDSSRAHLRCEIYQELPAAFSLRRKRFRTVSTQRTRSGQNRKSRSSSFLGLPLLRNHTETLATQASHVSGNERSRTLSALLESSRFTYTANVRFKLRISPNRKWAYEKKLKTILVDKKLREATNLCVEGYKFAFAVWSKQETWWWQVHVQNPREHVTGKKSHLRSSGFTKERTCRKLRQSEMINITRTWFVFVLAIAWTYTGRLLVIVSLIGNTGIVKGTSFPSPTSHGYLSWRAYLAFHARFSLSFSL